MLKKSLILSLFLCLFFTCRKIDDFRQICNPPFFFKEEIKASVDYTMIATQIFDPYCSRCHSTEIYLGTKLRVNYLALDLEAKSSLSENFNYINLLSQYIDFNNPINSKLIQVLKSDTISRYNNEGRIDYREPRNSCYLPDDYIQGLKWWIENAKTKDNLLK
jgi:hypothetical protein